MAADTPYKLQVLKTTRHTYLPNAYFLLFRHEIVTEIVHGITFLLSPDILSFASVIMPSTRSARALNWLNM